MDFKQRCKDFMEKWDGAGNGGENVNTRAYDYCKRAFDCYYKKINENGEELTEEIKDDFARSLYCYLASWGMVCRRSYLSHYSYKVLRNVCDVLFCKDYKDILDMDPLKENYKVKRIIELYRALQRTLPGASRLLLCKILMVTYGCVIAYDSHECASLEEFGITTNSSQDLTEVLLKDTVKIILDNKDSFDQMTNEDVNAHMESKLKEENAEYEAVKYSSVKVLDMCLWMEGQNE